MTSSENACPIKLYRHLCVCGDLQKQARFRRLDATFFTDKRNRHNTISEAGHVRTLAVLLALFYFHHAVAHTNMCLNILWRLLCWLQFFSQCCHKYPQRSHIVIPTAAPDILCDKGMGQYLADILGQQTQQLILNESLRCVTRSRASSSSTEKGFVK